MALEHSKRGGAEDSFDSPARALVEPDNPAAAMVVRLAAEVQQQLQGGLGDSALLHADAGVGGERGEHGGPSIVPKAGSLVVTRIFAATKLTA